MAARLNPRHQEMVRAKIQASQLINALQEHVLDDRELKDTQIRAAVALLNKCIPDLQRTELTGEGGGPLQIGVVRFSDLPAEQMGTKALPAPRLAIVGTGLPPGRTLPPSKSG
jgi:hypothetical protein